MEKLLVIEDSILQSRILKDLLTENSFAVDTAETGSIALQKMTANLYDMVLMDMVLPDITGTQLIKHIRLLPGTYDLPIIVLSGLTDKENVIESLGMGIHDYITKPYHPNELINRIRIHLGIRSTHKRLAESNAANDKFLSVLGHDLKSSLTLLYSAVSLLEKIDEDKIQGANIIQEAKRTTLQVNKLLDELLLWGRMVNHGIVQQNERFDFNEHARLCLAKLRDDIANKGIECNDEIKSEAFVYADKNMIEACLRNIIFNAKKFTLRGGTITLTSQSILIEGRPYNQISIIDNGIGLASEFVKNHFHRSSLSIEKDTEGNVGLGLGLSIAMEFIEKNSGKLQIQSERGKGSCFSIQLPAAE